MAGPTDTVPPPSYQMSQDEFDQKTARALQLSSSTTILVDEDGWPIYDAAAFEAVAGSSDRSPPASTSAGIVVADTSRNERRRQSFEKVPTSPRLMKKTRSSERRGRNPRREDEYSSEHRAVTPPPPFTPTGPSLDGPPFEDVVRMSYDESDSQAASPLEPAYSPPSRSAPPLPPQLLQPVEPLRLPPNRNRHSDSDIQTPTSSYPHRLPSPILSDVHPRPNTASAITRVEFDPRMAYSSSGGVGDHAAIQAGATAFYNHAVASQLTSPTASAPAQLGYMESRVSSPYSTEFPSSTLRAQHTMSSISLHDPYASQAQNPRFSTPTVPPPLPHQPQSTLSTLPGIGYAGLPSGAARGPLPPAPASGVPSSHARW